MSSIIHLQHTRGDTFKRVITFTDSSGTPINITGSTIIMTVRRKPEDAKIIAQGTAVLTTPASGIATVTIPATSFLVENGTYFYDVKWTDSLGVITTFMKGNFEISYNVT